MSTATMSSFSHRFEATFAMKKAMGRAITMSISVTRTAIRSVRSAIAWYTGSVVTVRMLSKVQVVDTFPGKVSTVQSAVISRAARAAMYTRTSHAAGAVSRPARRRRGLRWSTADTFRFPVRGGAGVGRGRVSSVMSVLPFRSALLMRVLSYWRVGLSP
jgi:hypothetical protein